MHEVYIIGTGNSLRGFDFSLLNREKIIAINYAYKYTRYDYLVALDKNFYIRNKIDFSARYGHHNIKFNSSLLQYNHEKINNSGYTALLLAIFKFQFKKINLLGFDHYWKDYKHFYDNEKISAGIYNINLEYYNIFKQFNIINYSEDSLIYQFPKKSIKELEMRLVKNKIYEAL